MNALGKRVPGRRLATVYVLGAVFAMLSASGATFADVPAPSARDRAQLEELNARWLRSYETRDRDALASVLGEDFVGLYGDRALGKPDMLARLANGRVTSVRWEDLRISVNGDTAVVTAVSTLVTQREQGPTTNRYRYADVYARRNGRWQAIASHVVPLGS